MGEEQFAYIPESFLTSPAFRTLPHAAFKVLAVLVLGKPKDRNGTMCCSESFAAKYGIAKNTVGRSLEELQKRGIVVVTRRVQRFKKHPTLYGVTWWPITHRDGEPLTRSEPATYAYLRWSITPTVGVETPIPATISSPPTRGDPTPTMGVDSAVHHPHLGQKLPVHHPNGGGQSSYLGTGATPESDPSWLKARKRAAEYLP
jgi:hypothetical protein